MKALEIAKYIISHFSNIATNEVEGDLTNLKLQKLLYYVQLEYHRKHKNLAFNDTIEAWDYGPVVPEVYHEYKKYGKQVLDIEEPVFSLPVRVKAIVDKVIKSEGQFTGYALMERTHEENPWKYAYNEAADRVITTEMLDSKTQAKVLVSKEDWESINHAN